MKKKLEIELDVVTGEIEVTNENELTYIEIMAVLEYTKMMFMKDWIDTE